MIGAVMDTRTLIIALLAQVSMLAAVAIYFGVRQSGTRAVGTWGTGLLVLALGLAAISMRGHVPDLVSITVANTLTMGANLLFYRALRIHQGRSVDDPLGIAALVATTVLIYLFSAVVPNFAARVVIVSAISGLLFARNALELRSPDVPPEVRLSRQFMQAIYWLITAMMAARVIINLVAPATDMMAPNASQTAYLVAILMTVTAATLGMFWMEIQHVHLELVRQAARDSLTGMLNRRSFHSALERELARARRGGSTLSVAMLDLDHFKRLNDTHGHPAGDEVLRSVAASMQASIRQPDILSRYGGEEFALLMPDTDAEMAMRVAERIRAAVQVNGVEWNGDRLSVTLSAGVAAFGAHGFNAEELISAADVALYEAKRTGRNRIVMADAREGEDGVPPRPQAATGTHATPTESIRSPQ